LTIDTLTKQASSRQRPKEWTATLPVEAYRMTDVPPVAGLAPYFQDWVTHERNDDYWHPWKISDHYAELKVKALHGGGWHDIFLGGSIRNYEGMLRFRWRERIRDCCWVHGRTRQRRLKEKWAMLSLEKTPCWIWMEPRCAGSITR
jgi:predicted acyl esterase